MKILLGMPNMGTIPSKTVISLLQTVQKGAVEPMLVDGSLIYDSRDAIARYAMENGYDYVLFADSDMIFSNHDLEALLGHNTNIVSGLYCTRRGEKLNVAYKEVITRKKDRMPKLIHDTKTEGYGETIACGFGFCLIKIEVIKTMFEKYKSLFEPKWGVGEDIAFCIRARKCGYKIMLDRNIKLGHIGDVVYEPT